jgi:hypothetical protein
MGAVPAQVKWMPPSSQAVPKAVANIAPPTRAIFKSSPRSATENRGSSRSRGSASGRVVLQRRASTVITAVAAKARSPATQDRTKERSSRRPSLARRAVRASRWARGGVVAARQGWMLELKRVGVLLHLGVERAAELAEDPGDPLSAAPPPRPSRLGQAVPVAVLLPGSPVGCRSTLELDDVRVVGEPSCAKLLGKLRDHVPPLRCRGVLQRLCEHGLDRSRIVH